MFEYAFVEWLCVGMPCDQYSAFTDTVCTKHTPVSKTMILSASHKGVYVKTQCNRRYLSQLLSNINVKFKISLLTTIRGIVDWKCSVFSRDCPMECTCFRSYEFHLQFASYQLIYVLEKSTHSARFISLIQSTFIFINVLLLFILLLNLFLKI